MQTVDSATDGLNAESKMVAQVSHAASNAANCEDAVASRITGLCFATFPAAIAGLIIALVVDSAQCHAGCWYSHVVEEIRKFHPSFCDSNASSTIVVELVCARVCASGNHVGPYRVELAAFSLSTMTVFEKSVIVYGLSNTTTGNRGAIADRGKNHWFDGSAEAFAQDNTNPLTVCDTMWKIGNHFKLSKPESDSRYSSRHGIGRFNVVFSSGRPASTGAHCEYSHAMTKGKV